MKHLLTLIAIFSSISVNAQNSISGHVVDENKEALYGATVVLLEATDSTIVNFCLANESGYYKINDLEQGQYILQVTYIAHQNLSLIHI